MVNKNEPVEESLKEKLDQLISKKRKETTALKNLFESMNRKKEADEENRKDSEKQ